MNITATLVGDHALELSIDQLPAEYMGILEKKMHDVVDFLQARVLEKLSGEVLQIRNGALYASIFRNVVVEDTRIIGTVYSTSPLMTTYERGATIRPHEIVVRNAKALRFVAGKIFFTRDDVVFAAKVNHPGAQIPARHIMGNTLVENAGLVKEMLRPYGPHIKGVL